MPYSKSPKHAILPQPVTERRSMAFANRTVLPGLTVALLRVLLILLILLALGPLGCGSDASAPVDEPFVPEAYGQWLKFEPEGAVCANGSQY